MESVPSSIGRYSIVETIGHGGMGSLYLAWDAKLERQIAIKVLKQDDDDLRERFAREAKSAARLRHPHIVTIFDLGEHEGRPYIAMEYIHGRTLDQIIRDREEMPLGRTLELMAELCDGLAFAHRAGIIHRDVKPANIMVDEQGSLKILDFGIARLVESAGMTQAGMMIGTLNYMSPEQVTGLATDHRSDIFAVGLVFYELLAQKLAFPGTVTTGVLGKILHTEPPPLAQVCPGLDEEVIRIVGRAIEKDAHRRYQDLTEMRRDVLTVRRHVEGSDGLTRVRDTPPPVPQPSAPPPASSQSASQRSAIEPQARPLPSHAEPADLELRTVPLPERGTGSTDRPAPPPSTPRSLSRGWMIAAAVAVVVLLAGGAYYRFGLSQLPAPPPEPAPRPVPAVAQLPPPAPAAAPAPPTVDPQVTRVSELVSEGQRLLGESKIDQARASFQQAQAIASTQAALDGLAEIDRRQRQLSASERDRTLAATATADAKRLKSSRKTSIALFNEGQKLEQQRQFDKADHKYRQAFAADKNNEEAAAGFARGERYRKAKAASLAAIKASDREGALRALGDARNIHSARFLADGLDKAIEDVTRGRRASPPAPAPSAPVLPADDKSAIEAVLGALARTLSTESNKSRDLTVVRRHWPSAAGDVFGDNESQAYVFTRLVFVEVTADSASVDCNRTRQVTPRSTGKTNILYDNVRIELRKANGAWQVQRIVERSR